MFGSWCSGGYLMLLVVSEMLGCPASRTASPPPLPAAPAKLAGKEKAIEVTNGAAGEARGLSWPGTVTPGDGHTRVRRACGGAEGVGWRCEGRRAGSEQKLH